MKKILRVGLLVLLSCNSLVAMELGVFAGSLSNPGTFVYGLSLSGDFLLPMLKIENEGMIMNGTGLKTLSAAIKLQPPIGIFSPYALFGFGVNFEKLDFEFSKYITYSLVGGGCFLRIAPVASLRFDMRRQYYAKVDLVRWRFSGGIFLNF